MKKVLYITYDGLTDPLGQSQILPYLVRLSKSGYLFHIISFEKKNNYATHSGEVQKIITDHPMTWHPLRYTKNPPVLSTLWDIYRMRKSALALHKNEKFRIVHCRSYIPSLVGMEMKKKQDVKFVFDMRGFWADERAEGGIWNLKNPVYKFIYSCFKRKEREFLASADYTVTLTHAAKNIIQNNNEIPNQPVPVQVIPCCVDADLFSREKIDVQTIACLKTRLQIGKDDFVISYLGSTGTWYLLDEMLLFFKYLLKTKPTAKFLFITFDKPDLILNKARELDIPASKFLIEKAKRDEVPSYLCLSNVSVIFIKNCFSKKASSPTKLGEIMALGIPVICNAGIGDTDQLLNYTKGGLLINKLNEEGYLHVINQINTLTAINRDQLVQSTKEVLSVVKGVELYREIYQKIDSR